MYNNNILYLYPEHEGQQYYMCWGFSKNTLDKNGKDQIRKRVLEGLDIISREPNRWVSKRSFSVFLGEDINYYWVAVPRQLTVKAMKIIGDKVEQFNPEIFITSPEKSFEKNIPFAPVISYDRGFIVDFTSIETKLASPWDMEEIVNI